MNNKIPISNTTDEDDEQILWNNLRKGKSSALNSLFKKYYEEMYFYGLKLVGKQEIVADEIQELFANLWETKNKIAEVKHVKAYLFTSLRNNLLKNKTKKVILKTELNTSNIDFSFDISPEEIYLNNESKDELHNILEELLNELSPKQKEIIYLKFYNNYSNLEISKILSIKQQSVSNLLLRTINTLRKKQKSNKNPIINLLITCLM
jgi:RNA polymerase sigma factor (sigma-70 family)